MSAQVPVVKVVFFDPAGAEIRLSLRFETLLLCDYAVDVRMAGSNSSVSGFPRTGDNANPDDDRYELPGPTHENDGRRVFCTVSVADQTGERGKYKIDLDVMQDNIVLDTVSTGERDLHGEFDRVLLVAMLTKK